MSSSFAIRCKPAELRGYVEHKPIAALSRYLRAIEQAPDDSMTVSGRKAKSKILRDKIVELGGGGAPSSRKQSSAAPPRARSSGENKPRDQETRQIAQLLRNYEEDMARQGYAPQMPSSPYYQQRLAQSFAVPENYEDEEEAYLQAQQERQQRKRRKRREGEE